MAPRILVVYYSRTGHTRKVALEIASALKADVEEAADHDDRRGFLGYLRSGRQAFFRRIVPIAPAEKQPGPYELVVVGTPIWNISVSAPVRSYLREHRREIRATAFFCTCDGMGVERVFDQMAIESGLNPVAKLAVTAADLDTDSARQAVAKFASDIQEASWTT